MVAQIQSSWETNRYIYTVAQIPPQKIVVFTKCKSQFEIIPTGVYILPFIIKFIIKYIDAISLTISIFLIYRPEQIQ